MSLSPTPPLKDVYATDEDIAIRAHDDYMQLCPVSQSLAQGTDGTIHPSDLWTFVSLSHDFEAIGVKAGNVIQLVASGGPYKGSGELLAIESASGNAIKLKRLGLQPNQGKPPAPESGLSFIRFEIKTFGPQIENASYDVNQDFSLDPNIAIRAPNFVYDPRQFRQATILTVLYRQYVQGNRSDKGDWRIKITTIEQELNRAKALITVSFGPAGNSAPPVTRFSTRITR